MLDGQAELATAGPTPASTILSLAAAGTITIGVLSDMSGQYSEAPGPGDFLAAAIPPSRII